jgi:hypothetical protein
MPRVNALWLMLALAVPRDRLPLLLRHSGREAMALGRPGHAGHRWPTAGTTCHQPVRPVRSSTSPAIAGAGPLIGPVLAAQFRLSSPASLADLHVVFAGPRNFVILVGHVRRKGKSLAESRGRKSARVAGITAAVAILA